MKVKTNHATEVRFTCMPRYTQHDSLLQSNNNIQGYFSDGMCQNAIPEVLSQKDTSRNGMLELFFPSIDITNTSPSSTEFWVTMYSGHTFFRKIALTASITITTTREVLQKSEHGNEVKTVNCKT
jgi:hypothetical protein